MRNVIAAAVLCVVLGCGQYVPPRPVGPTVTPVDPPTPTGPISVLIIEEKEQRHLLRQGERDAMASPECRLYVRNHGAKTTDGKTPDWRILDPDQDITGEHQLWKDGMARPRTQTPWVIITNGKAGADGPLPPSPEQFLEVLKKYGGP